MLDNCDILIPDSDGNLRDIDSVITELERALSDFSTHAMSDRALYLQGKYDGLSEVIEYLKKI